MKWKGVQGFCKVTGLAEHRVYTSYAIILYILSILFLFPFPICVHSRSFAAKSPGRLT
jgi:hypothetical protein